MNRDEQRQVLKETKTLTVAEPVIMIMLVDHGTKTTDKENNTMLAIVTLKTATYLFYI